MDEYIKGNINKIIFQGENGYKIGLFKVSDASYEYADFIGITISFTGYFHELNEQDTYMLYGKLFNHPKYGEQFNIDHYERCMPEEKDSIIEFLSSSIFKGIGDKTAIKIVEVLGDSTLSTILERPDNLLLIPGVTKKQIDILHKALVDYESSYTTILKLNDIGFVTKDSMLIYNKYKGNTLSNIEEDLYQLTRDIRDINFKKIDMIALRQNYDRDDIRRIKSAILYTMEEMCNLLGHSYLDIKDIYSYTIRVLGNNISEEIFIEAMNSLILNLFVIKDDIRYYLKEMWDAEDNIVKRVKYLINKDKKVIKKIDNFIEDLEKDMNITYDEVQLTAVKEAMLQNFLIITGGPGTGKTTIIKSIVEMYKNINKLSYGALSKEVVLLAPTGRAAKRLSTQAVFPASTIHSFLKWNKESNKFSVNEYSKSDAKVAIIDEASMIDVYLFDSLLKGLKLDTTIIIVGDYNQLPSVGPGQLLKDLIEANSRDVVYLKQLYRQKDGSNIIKLAYDINDGVVEESVFDKGKDLKLFETNNIMSTIRDIAVKHKDDDYKEFQILVPMYKTINGIDNINKVLQDMFNPKSSSKKEISIGENVYREGDKILQLVNMPDEKIYNGDIGIIDSINKKEMIVDFDGNSVKFTPSNYGMFKHGYAISIHKSQGSEFNTVVIPVVGGYGKMLYRKLYYTAVTRSKNNLYIVGDLNALRVASNNNYSDIRKTSIKEKLEVLHKSTSD